MRHRRNNEEPCDSYSGNLCGGFGGETDMTCWNCGWQRYEHMNRYPKRPERESVEETTAVVTIFGTNPVLCNKVLNIYEVANKLEICDRIAAHPGKCAARDVPFTIEFHKED